MKRKATEIDGFRVGDHVFVKHYDELDRDIECHGFGYNFTDAFYSLSKSDIERLADMDDLYIQDFHFTTYKNGVDLYSSVGHEFYVTTDMLYPKEPDEIDVGDDLDSFMDELIAGGK